MRMVTNGPSQESDKVNLLRLKIHPINKASPQVISQIDKNKHMVIPNLLFKIVTNIYFKFTFLISQVHKSKHMLKSVPGRVYLY